MRSSFDLFSLVHTCVLFVFVFGHLVDVFLHSVRGKMAGHYPTLSRFIARPLKSATEQKVRYLHNTPGVIS